ncbi:MAG: AAA-associated domain-containing protein [Thermoplasmata archaeon]|nr:AAA-associated domain-containing protein [Thermoplasmata archaeon]
MPTTYPKAAPSEVQGLLVLLNDHKGTEDIARLADDLDLEIDEILPAVEYAEALALLSIADGRATLTDIGRKLLAGTITERKTILRDQLKRTTLFRALMRALEGAPEGRLSEEEVTRLIEFTTAPADDFVQNIINWGRYTELFRYDANERVLLPSRSRPQSRNSPPPGRGGSTREGKAVPNQVAASPGSSGSGSAPRASMAHATG